MKEKLTRNEVIDIIDKRTLSSHDINSIITSRIIGIILLIIGISLMYLALTNNPTLPYPELTKAQEPIFLIGILTTIMIIYVCLSYGVIKTFGGHI